MDQIGVKEASLLSAVAAALLYLNTLDGELLGDDDPAIAWNMDVRPSSPWTQLLRNDFWGTPVASASSHKSYRPLCVATFRLNYMLHGLQPMGYHLVNLLLHAVVCYLYVGLCARVFKQVWPALLAGLLFAVHPIPPEAVSFMDLKFQNACMLNAGACMCMHVCGTQVANVVGRAELLSALLFLLAFESYCKSLSTSGNQTQSQFDYTARHYNPTAISLHAMEM